MRTVQTAFGPVAVAETFLERLRGIGEGGAVLAIPGRSVHGLWMRRPIRVAAVDADGEVLAVRHLHPRRVVTVPGARWMIEMPLHHDRPAVGDRVILS